MVKAFGRLSMIGRPLMVMPAASTSSRASVTKVPLLLAASPETSTTRRNPLQPLPSNSGLAKLSAPEIEVREARRAGGRAILLAEATGAAATATTRHGK